MNRLVKGKDLFFPNYGLFIKVNDVFCPESVNCLKKSLYYDKIQLLENVISG